VVSSGIRTSAFANFGGGQAVLESVHDTGYLVGNCSRSRIRFQR